MSTFLSLLILYMTYARLRSVQAPMTFSSEKLLKFPHLVICVFWLTGIICWTLAAVLFRIYPFTTHIAYKPDFSQFIINLFLWFLPLFSIYILGAAIIINLHKLQARKKRMNVKSFHGHLISAVFDAKSKFTILIVAFLVQVTVPCLFMLVEAFVIVTVEEIKLAFKWSTYTVTLTDPILILIFIL